MKNSSNRQTFRGSTLYKSNFQQPQREPFGISFYFLKLKD